MPDTNFTHPMRKWEDILTIVSGKNQKNVETDNGQYPIYGSGGIIGRANAFLCEAGTTIVGRKGTINSPIYVNERFWNVDTAFGIVPGPELLPKFLYYFCRHFNFKDLDKSTTIPSLAKRDLLAIKMVVPSLPEQERIVARIEELFSELDKAVETLNTTKQQLAVYRQAVITTSFPELTSSNSVRLDEIAEISGGITKGRDLSQQKTITLPYLRVANVQNGYLDLSQMKDIEVKLNEVDKYLLQEGDVLYTEGGDRDKLGRGTVWKNEIPRCVHQNHVFKARLNQERALPQYVAYWSMSVYARDYFFKKGKQSVNLASINKTVLSALILPMPSLEEQASIINNIESRLSVCDQIEKTIEQSLQQAEALRQSILKQAFEGRL